MGLKIVKLRNFALMDQFMGSITTPVEIRIESILQFRIFQMRFFYTLLVIPILEKGPLSFTFIIQWAG